MLVCLYLLLSLCYCKEFPLLYSWFLANTDQIDQWVEIPFPCKSDINWCNVMKIPVSIPAPYPELFCNHFHREVWEVRAGMRQERSIPSIEIGSQGEKLGDFIVSPAVTQSTFMYPSLPLSPSIMCSPCFAKVFSSLSICSFTLYPRTYLCLVADVGTSLTNQGVQNCAETLFLEESLLWHLKRESYLPENWQDASVYTIHKLNYAFALPS